MVSKKPVGNSGHRDPASQTLGALVDMNHPALQDVLAEVVHHPSRPVRVEAALRLAELFQDVRAVPGLAEALDDADRRLQKAAAEALWEIGDADTEGLLNALRAAPGPTRDRIADALDRIGWQPDDPADLAAYLIVARRWRDCISLGRSSINALIRATRDHDGNVRRGAAWALGEIADQRAVPALIRLLDDTEGGMFSASDRVCDVAAEALENIGTSEASQALEDYGYL